MALGRKATVTTMSVMPWRRSSDTMCSIIGRPTRGSIGLGRFDVCGRKRVPSPPAMITAFIRCSSRGAALAQGRPRRGDVAPGRPPGQHEADQSRHPADDADRLLPAGGAVAEQKGGVREHQSECARLADPQHIDARRTQGRQQDHHGRHQDLAGDRGDPEPEWHRAVDHDGDHRRPHEQPVRRRVEDLAER